MKYEHEELHCSLENEETRARKELPSYPLFNNQEVNGRQLNPKYNDMLFGIPFRTSTMFVITYVHIAGIPNQFGKIEPVVEQDWVDTLIQVANDIWSQACIKIFPLFGDVFTELWDIGLTAFLGSCIDFRDEKQIELVQQHDATTPNSKIVNIYLVRETNGIACGSPLTGRIFLPTVNRTPESMGRTLAHELGHLLLNPTGVDDSNNPDHLMFHTYSNPDILPGSRDGLFLSDCVGARTTAMENYAVFDLDTGSNQCVLNPHLGNNLVLVQPAKFVKA